MKHLLTHCPRCRAQFYIGEDERRGRKVNAFCPYCNLHYKDVWDPSKIKEAKYQWELYRGIYSPVNFSKGGEMHLKVGGMLLFSTFIFFVIGMLSVIFTDRFSVAYQGVALSGVIFSIFVALGAFNAYEKKSFVLSLVGSIFSIMNSVIWGGLNSIGNFILVGGRFSSLYILLSLISSFIALILIILNRENFNFGY